MLSINVQVTVGGTDISDYVAGVEHHHNICEPTATGTVYLSSNFDGDVDTYDEIVIYEQGTKTFTGYVTSITRERLPAQWSLAFADETIKLRDYCTTQVYKTGDETVKYWIELFCNLVGVNYTFDTNLPTIIAGFVPKDFEFPYSSVLDLIKQLCDINGYWIYTSPDGKIHFSQGHAVSPTITIETNNNVLSFNRERSLDKTRNRAVVFGQYPEVAESSTTVDGLDFEKTVVVASPFIPNVQGIADRLVDAFARVEDKKIFEISGDPDVTLAQFAHIHESWSNLHMNSQITGLDTFINSEGYKQRVILDQECPKVWTSVPLSNPILAAFNYGAGTHLLSENGRWFDITGGSTVLDNHGDVFNASGIALISVTNGQIWRTDTSGDIWEQIVPSGTMPNDWFDTTPPAFSDLNYFQYIPSTTTSGVGYFLANWQEVDSGDGNYRGYVIKASNNYTTWQVETLWGLPTITIEGVGYYSPSAYVSYGNSSTVKGYCTLDDPTYALGRDPDNNGAKFTYHYVSDNGYVITNVVYEFRCSLIPDNEHIFYWQVNNKSVAQTGSRRMFDRTFNCTVQTCLNGSSWTLANADGWSSYSDTYAWSNPECDWTSNRNEFRFVKLTFEPPWEITDHSKANGQTGYVDAIRCYGPFNFDVTQFKPARAIWMAQDNSYLWVTCLRPVWVGADLKTCLMLEKRDKNTLALVSETRFGEVTDAELQNKNYIMYPATPFGTAGHCTIYGRFKSATTESLYHIAVMVSGNTFQSIENSWQSDYCSALRIDHNNNYDIVRHISSGVNQFYRGTGITPSGLTYTMDLPFGVYVGAMDVNVDNEVALGAIIVSTSGLSVIEVASPYSSYTDLSSDYPQYGSVTGLSYIE